MEGRLLEEDLGDPYSNLALEEALFKLRGVPTLRVWENQKSVVIGRAQLARFETDLGYCRRNSIPVVRRTTAGGAVYNGPGNLNWSFFVPRVRGQGGAWETENARVVFSSFASLVAGALGRCGVECEFRAPNSIVNGRGKISGIAAYVSKESVLCHGTLLIEADLAEVERLTRPSEEGLDRRYPRSRFVRVSNCGVRRRVFVEELAIRSGFVFEPSSITAGERELVSELLAKYRSERWNLGDPFELDDL